MTRQSDNWGMRRRRSLDDRSADALLSGRAVDGEPVLTAFVADLTAQAVAAPPSAALAALLADGFVPDPTTVIALSPVPRTGVRRWALQVSLGAAACVAVSVGAAANGLPAPLQTTVANVVEALTPLTVPRPADDDSPAITPTPDRTLDPATETQPTDDPSGEPSDDASPEESDRSVEPGDVRATPRASEQGDGDRDDDAGEDRVEPRGDERSRTPEAEDGEDRPATQQPTSASTPSPDRSQEPDSRESSGSNDDRSGSGSGLIENSSSDDD